MNLNYDVLTRVTALLSDCIIIELFLINLFNAFNALTSLLSIIFWTRFIYQSFRTNRYVNRETLIQFLNRLQTIDIFPLQESKETIQKGHTMWFMHIDAFCHNNHQHGFLHSTSVVTIDIYKLVVGHFVASTCFPSIQKWPDYVHVHA